MNQIKAQYKREFSIGMGMEWWREDYSQKKLKLKLKLKVELKLKSKLNLRLKYGDGLVDGGLQPTRPCGARALQLVSFYFYFYES